MTAGQEIEAVVKTLSKGLKTGLAAKIKVTFSAVEQLIKVLEDKQCDDKKTTHLMSDEIWHITWLTNDLVIEFENKHLLYKKFG